MITFSNIYGVNCSGSGGFRKLSNDAFCLTNATYEAQVNTLIFLDTRNGEFSINFPTIAEPGDTIILVDTGGNLKLENVAILNLGKLFTTPVTEYLVDKNWSITKFVFVTSAYGWIVDHTFLDHSLAENPINNIPEFIWNYIANANSTIIATATNLNEADILLNDAIISIAAALNAALSTMTKSVNNITPDSNGNINLPLNIGTVRTVNNIPSDVSGNVDVPLTNGTVRSVNAINPDSNGNVVIPLTTGTVSSVNNITADINGNVNVGTVKSVNSLTPDSNGNVLLASSAGGTVKSVNNLQPDVNGNVTLNIPGGTIRRLSAVSLFLSQ
ncbi:MAG: hypothetical protein IPH62_19550 [Ignavibacteriae bacterium]|nr:hypothetical protein [Ignavibacteriota bacterium]